MYTIKYIACFILCFCIVIKSSAQEWKVPEDKKKKTSPYKFTPATISQGEAIYLKNCQSCHGLPGKGNFAKLNPVPGDMSTERFQKQLDGELFFKFTSGRGIMPSFKNILGEEDRWSLLSFIRSFNKNYVQPPLGAPSTGCKECKTKLSITYLKEKKAIQVEAMGSVKDVTSPIAEAEISLFVKRYFGNMQIGKAITSNKNGISIFPFPNDLPGDKEGNIQLIVKFSEEKQFGEQQDTIKLQIGIPTDKPGLNTERAMWNVVTKAPIWLLFTYVIIVLSVLGCILYIIAQLFKLKKIAGNSEKK